MGIAVLEKIAREKEKLVFSECFKTSAKLPHHQRLALIGKRIGEIIKKYKPEQLATEKLFFSGNQKTAMLVAEARGVILYTGSSLGLEIFEYTPNTVKVAITSYGRSEKGQIISMVEKLIDIKKSPQVPQGSPLGELHRGKPSVKLPSSLKLRRAEDDEFDAIAIGLTHFAIYR